MIDERSYIAPGVSGWSKRQAAAEKKAELSRRQTASDAARRRQREFEDALAAYVNQAKAEGRDKDEAYREFVAAHQRGEAPSVAPPDPEKEPEGRPDGDSEAESGESGPESLPEPADMDRDALIAELQDAGEKVHPASKDATLRRKVSEARNG